MSKKVKRDWIWITPNSKPQPVTLTKRQEQVLGLIASGYRTKEIAYELGLKPETISMHLSIIRRKYDAKTNAHAVCIANITLQGIANFKP